MKLRVYPDPILTQVSEPVTDFSLSSLGRLCDDLYTTMVESGGIGLSAVQVGVLQRIIVMDASLAAKSLADDLLLEPSDITDQHKWTFINPEIVASDGEFVYSEGCLSVPGYFEQRQRFNRIALEFNDIKGDRFGEEFEGIEAFCIQHELDHLDGKLFIDDLSPLKKDRIRKKIEKNLRRK